MNWIHTLTNHFTDELRVTGGKDKHSKADRGGRLQKCLLCFHKLDKVDYTGQNMERRKGDFVLYSPFLLSYSVKVKYYAMLTGCCSQHVVKNMK